MPDEPPAHRPEASQRGKDSAPMKLVLAASEVVGFAKTGGLADVAGSLPRTLAHRGHDCVVFLPLYHSVRASRTPLYPTVHRFALPVRDRTVTGSLWRAVLPGSDVPAYLVEQPEYFERDDPAQDRGLYQFTLPGGARRDYPDNCERFAFFCRAILESLPMLNFWPDVIHANDWQTGLLPVYFCEQYRWRPGYGSVRTLFTIHNMAYQGRFPPEDLAATGLDGRLFNYHQLEFYGQLNLLKAGIVFANLITTVSPTYAQEIQTPYFGYGLEGVLAERRDRLFGIVNGVDYDVWDPATDPHLAARYDADSVAEGKPHCKAALQRRFGLTLSPRTPLIGMVARLVEQKGVDLVASAAEELFRQDVQLVILGEGDPYYHRLFRALQARHRKRVGLAIAFDEALAHQIEGGADLFLMPSQYEPSGLNQLYSLRYGTVPVVRATGGLADTVTDCTPESMAAGTATGFSFVPYTVAALQAALTRALDLYRDRPDDWLRVMRTGMRQDWSWARSAAAYERLYSRLRDRN
jgi:starch synthase